MHLSIDIHEVSGLIHSNESQTDFSDSSMMNSVSTAEAVQSTKHVTNLIDQGLTL